MEEAGEAGLSNRPQFCLPLYTSELLVFYGFVEFFGFRFFVLFCFSGFCFVFETAYHYGGLAFSVLLSRPKGCWDYMYMPPYPAQSLWFCGLQS